MKNAYKVVGVRINDFGRPERVRLFRDTLLEAKFAKDRLIDEGYRAAMFTRAEAHSQVMEQVVR